jgi:hypothetical protein
MAAVILVDTTVFLNVLNIPGFNQNREKVMHRFKRLMGEPGTNLLLPMAAIIEAGNHVAHLSDGRERRRWACVFADQVRAALQGDAPWRPTPMPDVTVMAQWLDEFPDHAMRGIGLGDLSIIKEWEAAGRRHPAHRIMIWSLYRHLSGYDLRR